MAGLFAPEHQETAPSRPVSGPVNTAVSQDAAVAPVVPVPQQETSTVAPILETIGDLFSTGVSTYLNSKSGEDGAEALKPYFESLRVIKKKEQSGALSKKAARRQFDDLASEAIINFPGLQKEIRDGTTAISGYDVTGEDDTLDLEEKMLEADIEYLTSPEGQPILLRSQVLNKDGTLNQEATIEAARVHLAQEYEEKAIVAARRRQLEMVEGDVQFERLRIESGNLTPDDQLGDLERDNKIAQETLNAELRDITQETQRVQAEIDRINADTTLSTIDQANALALQDMEMRALRNRAEKAQLAFDESVRPQREQATRDELTLGALETEKTLADIQRKKTAQRLFDLHRTKVASTVDGLLNRYLQSDLSMSDIEGNAQILFEAQQEIAALESQIRKDGAVFSAEDGYKIDEVLAPIAALQNFLKAPGEILTESARQIEARDELVFKKALEKQFGMRITNTTPFMESIAAMLQTGNRDWVLSLLDSTDTSLWDSIDIFEPAYYAEPAVDPERTVTGDAGSYTQQITDIVNSIPEGLEDEAVTAMISAFNLTPISVVDDEDSLRYLVERFSIATSVMERMEDGVVFHPDELSKNFYTSNFVAKYRKIVEQNNEYSHVLQREVSTHLNRNLKYRVALATKDINSSTHSSSLQLAYDKDQKKWRVAVANTGYGSVSTLARAQGAEYLDEIDFGVRASKFNFGKIREEMNTLNQLTTLMQQFPDFADKLLDASAPEVKRTREHNGMRVITSVEEAANIPVGTEVWWDYGNGEGEAFVVKDRKKPRKPMTGR